MFMDPAEPVGFMFSPIFARGTGDQTSEPQHKLESKITSPVSWHGHGRSSSFMENTIKIGGCSIAMLVYRSVGIFGISTKQKNTSKWNAKSPSRLQLFGHESHFSSIEGTYITSIPEQNYMWCSCFKKSWGHCSNSSSSQSIVDNARQLSNNRNKKLFHGFCLEPLQHPLKRFHSPGDCASLQLLNTLESLTFIPFLGKAESATRQQIGISLNDMTARHQERWQIFQEIIQTNAWEKVLLLQKNAPCVTGPP